MPATLKRKTMIHASNAPMGTDYDSNAPWNYNPVYVQVDVEETYYNVMTEEDGTNRFSVEVEMEDNDYNDSELIEAIESQYADRLFGSKQEYETIEINVA